MESQRNTEPLELETIWDQNMEFCNVVQEEIELVAEEDMPIGESRAVVADEVEAETIVGEISNADFDFYMIENPVEGINDDNIYIIDDEAAAEGPVATITIRKAEVETRNWFRLIKEDEQLKMEQELSRIENKLQDGFPCSYKTLAISLFDCSEFLERDQNAHVAF